MRTKQSTVPPDLAARVQHRKARLYLGRTDAEALRETPTDVHLTLESGAPQEVCVARDDEGVRLSWAVEGSIAVVDGKLHAPLGRMGALLRNGAFLSFGLESLPSLEGTATGWAWCNPEHSPEEGLWSGYFHVPGRLRGRDCLHTSSLDYTCKLPWDMEL